MNQDQPMKKSLGQKIKGMFKGKDKASPGTGPVVHQEVHHKEVTQTNVYEDAPKTSTNQVIVPPGPAIVPAVMIPVTAPAPAQVMQQPSTIQPVHLPQMHDPLYNSHQIIRGVTPPVESMIAQQGAMQRDMLVSTHIETSKAPIPSGKPLLTQTVEESNRVHNTLYVPGGDIQQFNSTIPPIVHEKDIRAQEAFVEAKERAAIEVAKEEAATEVAKEEAKIEAIKADYDTIMPTTEVIKTETSDLVRNESRPLNGPANPNLIDPMGPIMESRALLAPADPTFTNNLQKQEMASRHLADSNPNKPKPFDQMQMYGKIPNPAYAGGKPFFADILRNPDPYRQAANPPPHQHVPLHVIGERAAEQVALNQANKVIVEERKDVFTEKKSIM